MTRYATVDVDAIFGPDDYADWLRDRAEAQAAEREIDDDGDDDGPGGTRGRESELDKGTIAAQQGGHVGVTYMGFAGVHRLAVRTPGTEGAVGIGSVYLTGDECQRLAELIRPVAPPASPPAAEVAAELRRIADKLSAVRVDHIVEGVLVEAYANDIRALAARLDGAADRDG